MFKTIPGPELKRLAIEASRRASEALSLLLNEEIDPIGPAIYYADSPEAIMVRLRRSRHLLSITQAACGSEPGRFSLVMARSSVPGLIDTLMGRHGSVTRDLGGVELDALRETGNIVAGSCLSMLGGPLGLSAMPAQAAINEGSLEEVVYTFLPQPRSLCVETRLRARTHHLELILLLAVARTSVASQLASATSASTTSESAAARS